MSGWAAAAQAASQIGGTLIANSANRKAQNRQFKYQQQLMDIQQKHQMNLNEQGHKYQKEMWDYTNTENQVKHMENAGLNIGLM